MTVKQQSLAEKRTEFIGLMALLMSLVALTIDAILPALSQITHSFNTVQSGNNEGQLLLSTVFIGMAFGLMIYGPLSDAYGRKKVIFLGLSIFLIGSITSLIAKDFNTMLWGRFIQGFGAAACRVVSSAMIRDKFKGREMAKVMSLITAIFIVVPAIAPSIGQTILFAFNWKAIFIFVIFISLVSATWLQFRQPETLALQNRRSFSIKVISRAILETVTTPTSLGYMIASGLIFGSFIGYLSTSQPLLQVEYQLGNSFSLVFGGLSLFVGISSYFNSKLLAKYSMERLCFIALIILALISSLFLLYSWYIDRLPRFSYVFIYLALVFYCLGILFGNFNALAMKPLGHIAGTASSTITSIQMLISASIGTTIGHFYNHDVIPLVLGFTLSALASLMICLIINYLHSKKH